MKKELLDEIISTIYLHKEGEKSRNECDADGLCCRSGCIRSAVERLKEKYGSN